MQIAEISGEAKNSSEALSDIKECLPDIVIIDLNLEEQGAGLKLLEELRRCSRAKLIVHSYRENIQTIAFAYGVGADGYVPKNCDPDVLIDVINKVANSNRPVYLNGMEEKINEFNKHNKYNDPRKVLNERDLEILKLLADGLSIEEVAEAMSLSDKTVHNKTTEIKNKINCNRSDFTEVAILYDILTIT